MEQDKIIVMMSTYNGEKFVKEQIESILNQENVEVKLIIRDDGSDDSTKDIINGLKKENIELIAGSNIGWKESFNELLRGAGTCQYYAFSDQDDVWLPEKLARGISFIKKEKVPCLYYSDATIVDEKLNKIGIKKNKAPFPEKETNLVNCAGQGCCMVFNYAAKELFCKYKPREVFSHEAWMSILCNYFGKVFYDNHSYILYRQHSGGNVNGAFRPSVYKLFVNYIHSIKNHSMYPHYADEIFNGYGEYLDSEDKKIILNFITYKKSWKSKLALVFKPSLHRESIMGTFGLKLAFLFSLF